MEFSSFYPYRSAEARDSYLAYYDAMAKEWPVPSEERMASTSYAETFVRIAGPANAPPLVLLPGVLASSLMWTPNIKALSQACRVFAVDRPGDIGRSVCAKAVRNGDDLIAWLNELFDTLKLDRLNLAGVSFGGWLTALYAVHFPARVDKAVLIAPGETVVRFSIELLARIGLSAARIRTGPASLFHWMFKDLARTDPKEFSKVLDQLETAIRAIQPRNLLRTTVLKDSELRKLPAATLFIVGENEVMYAVDKAVRRLQRVAPHAKVEIVSGAGHDLTLVQAETVNRLIVDFLTHGGEACRGAGRGLCGASVRKLAT